MSKKQHIIENHCSAVKSKANYLRYPKSSITEKNTVKLSKVKQIIRDVKKNHTAYTRKITVKLSNICNVKKISSPDKNAVKLSKVKHIICDIQKKHIGLLLMLRTWVRLFYAQTVTVFI